MWLNKFVAWFIYFVPHHHGHNQNFAVRVGTHKWPKHHVFPRRILQEWWHYQPCIYAYGSIFTPVSYCYKFGKSLDLLNQLHSFFASSMILQLCIVIKEQGDFCWAQCYGLASRHGYVSSSLNIRHSSYEIPHGVGGFSIVARACPLPRGAHSHHLTTYGP